MQLIFELLFHAVGELLFYFIGYHLGKIVLHPLKPWYGIEKYEKQKVTPHTWKLSGFTYKKKKKKYFYTETVIAAGGLAFVLIMIVGMIIASKLP